MYTSRTEHIATIPLTATNTSYSLPTNGGLIPSDRWLSKLTLTFAGRMTNPAANGPSSILADAPYSLVQRVRISGFHRPRSTNDTFIDLRGADLRQMMRIDGGRVPFMAPSVAGAPTFVRNLSTTANATNDIKFSLDVPFAPLRIPPQVAAGYLLDAPNWNSLKLEVTFSDAVSVFAGQTTQPAFTAYGSTSGNPSLTVHGDFVQAGAALDGLVPGRVFRYGIETSAGNIVNGGTNLRLIDVPKGFAIRSMLLKTGVKAAVTAGNDVYGTLSNSVLSNILLNVGLGKPIRRYSDFYHIQQDTESHCRIFPDDGYALLDFVQNGVLGEALNTAGMTSASVNTDVYLSADVSGTASQALLAVVEELRYRPTRVSAR